MSYLTHTFTKGDRVLKPGTFSDRYGTVINVWADADVAVVRWDDGTQGSYPATDLYAIDDD
jgi:hypothetical protein